LVPREKYFHFFSARSEKGLARFGLIVTFSVMNDPALLSKQALIDLVHRQQAAIDSREIELQSKDTTLQTQRRQLQTKDVELHSKDAELQTKDGELQTRDAELRRRDIQLQEQQLALEKVQKKYESLQLAYNNLLLQRFGNRSERYIENPDQLRIDFGNTDQAADAAVGLADAVEDLEQTIPEHTRRRPRKKRDESLPEHLPRYEVVADVPEAEKNCPTHGQRTQLPESMWDQTETLEYQPPKLNVRVTKYPKYACENEPQCGITSAERPTSIVEGNKYDTSIAAEIITGKYSYHLPLYRLQDYFGGCGWTPSRSTQYNILSNTHFVIQPLLEFFKGTVQSDPVVGTDETRVTLLFPKAMPNFDLQDPKERRMHEVFTEALEKKKPSINGRMWAYRGASVGLNVFDFTVSRHRDGPQLFFADYEGTLLGDCWSGFEAISVASGGRIVRAACNAHARRKFENSIAYPDERKLWLRWYRELYDIEDRGKELSPDQRLELRQTEAAPIWDDIASWLDEVNDRTSNVILPQSDLGKALQYVRNHFTQLKHYLQDPAVAIDNNLTEQLMRQVAVGRKNWLFAGSVAGGERSAGFLTLASSALRNDLDVWLYIKDVLDQLLAGRTDYEPLLPWNWAQVHPHAIRTYRVEERKTRTERKIEKRHRRRLNKPRPP
jgi:transposase